MTWTIIYLRIEQIIGSLIYILQRRSMSCCPTTGGPFWRALLMTFECVCHQTPCFHLRVPCTARWCIKVLLYSSGTPAELADDNSFPVHTVDGADAAAVSSNAPRGQLPVWWGSGGFSVWDWNHESILLPHLWFLHNCPFRSEHWQHSHHQHCHTQLTVVFSCRFHFSFLLHLRTSVYFPEGSARSEWMRPGGCGLKTGSCTVWGQYI